MKKIVSFLGTLFLLQSLVALDGQHGARSASVTSLARHITAFNKDQTIPKQYSVGLPTLTGFAGVCAMGATAGLLVIPAVVYGTYKIVKVVAAEVDCSDALDAEKLFNDVQKEIRRDLFLNHTIESGQDLLDYAYKRFATSKFPLTSLNKFLAGLDFQLVQAYDKILCMLDTIEDKELSKMFQEACLALKQDIETLIFFVDNLKQVLLHTTQFKDESKDYKIAQKKKADREREYNLEQKKKKREREEQYRKHLALMQNGALCSPKYLYIS